MDEEKRRESLPEPREAWEGTHWLGAPEEEPTEAGTRDLRRVLTVAFLAALVALFLALFSLLRYAPGGETPAVSEGESETQGAEKIVFIREYDPDSGILTTPELYGRWADSAVSVYGEGSGYGGSASGFVFRSDGYIATAYRAVEGAKRIFVTLSDGRSLEAELIGGEALCDLALLRVDAENLSVVSFGQSEALLVGERVLAIGASPSEDGVLGACSAEISYPLRSLGIRDTETGLLQKKVNLMGVDRVWASSFAGGPIFDEYGSLVGMVSAHREGELGFFLPAEGLSTVLEAFLSEESPSDRVIAALASSVPRLGILGERAAVDGMYGVRIRGFSSGLCSAASMLKEGDLILRIGGIPVTAPEEVLTVMEDYSVGDVAMVEILRHGQVLGFEVVLTYFSFEKEK